MNRLIREIGRVCGELPLEEKLLLCPTNRIGWQWQESAARGGFGLINIRPQTLRTTALTLAQEAMGRQGLSYIDDRGADLLMEAIVSALGPRLSYFDPSRPGLAPLLRRAASDLGLAGLDPGKLSGGSLESGAKGRDLAALLAAYGQRLRENNLVDYSGALRLALDRIARNREEAADKYFLIPDFLDLLFLERRLVESLPPDRVRHLACDRPISGQGAGEEEAGSDLDLLRWLARPGQAPAPRADGSVEVGRAVGQVNEVRGALRACLREGLPLDSAELLYTDRGAYLPLIYETLSKIRPLEEAAQELPPATFAEGVPGIFARPCRALAGWAEWIRDDFSPLHLVRMIGEGLLHRAGSGQGRPSFADLAQTLGSLGLGRGRKRYLPRLRRELERLRGSAEQAGPGTGKRRRLLETLEEMLSGLLELTPEAEAPGPEVLAQAVVFVEQKARAVNELDQNARLKLTKEIKDRLHWIEALGIQPREEAWAWLRALPESIHLLGSGPRPGRIHVAPALSGGHSGRTRTFILGLDESRFPGAGLQDPILLDSERTRLSKRLTTAARDLDRRSLGLGLLLARLRGRVSLSYSCLDLAQNSEMFPAGPIISAFRLLSGKGDGDQADLESWLGPPQTFAPGSLEECLDAFDYWLLRLCGLDRAGRREELVEALFPDLARGRAAREARQGSLFGPHDGHVPGAVQDPASDPFQAQGPVMSAGRLELLGRCPLAYFFRHLLELKAPDEPSPDDWLGPLEKGSLLHQGFQEFMERLIAEQAEPCLEKDLDSLCGILERLLESQAQTCPPPDPDIVERRRTELRRIAAVFLKEEEEARSSGRPVFLETEIGFGERESANALERAEPVELTLPSGRRVRLRGRLDRIDLRPGDGLGYAVWDYKTGRGAAYDQEEPFAQGRVIQPFLYLVLARAALGELDPGARAERFGYILTSLARRGERMEWTGEELARGGWIVERLCGLAAQGAFPATDDKSDCDYCDFRDLCGDPAETAASVKAKLDDPDNIALEHFRALRRSEK